MIILLQLMLSNETNKRKHFFPLNTQIQNCVFNFGIHINFKKYAAVSYIDETNGIAVYLVPKVRA